jgi:hypothetical protein
MTGGHFVIDQRRSLGSALLDTYESFRQHAELLRASERLAEGPSRRGYSTPSGHLPKRIHGPR